jgi:aspartate kinase
MAYTNGFEQSIPHQQEKNLPGGGNWVVQKFGGTSVGKFAIDIANDIVMYVTLLAHTASIRVLTPLQC